MTVEQIGAFAFAIIFFVVGVVCWVQQKLFMTFVCAIVVIILAAYASGLIGATPTP